ncbi:ABC transporter substrate-binding protein [Microbispora sp. RL4-1S]|uniref:ABC transporter substrate-binding protein n=1 Tax=Microbispora oryzae TaxID=2806554 RepID=A0A940WFA7_9ACTN|nr:ABC transporter substrate-binding protein [Microbispora oryzae]MBP2704569.1 ABC transporter substrate-binding protein [Microbispora oryzae]
MRNRPRFLIPLLAVGLLTACSGVGADPAPAPSQEGGAADQGAGGSLPRNQTLYTSGTQWGPPSNWNPLREWDSATGTKGFVYETLFIYDPDADTFTPWLAQSGEWTGPKEYTLKLRPGITWSDGKPLTADDVVFTFELGKMETVPYHPLWSWLKTAEAVDAHTVKFTFSTANYQEWANHLYSRAILPKHIWANRSEDEVMNGANENPVGTGPYAYKSHDQDRMVWVKRDNWWATKALGKDVKPKYIVDYVNSSNEVAMNLLLQKGLDLSTNFLPGIGNLVTGDFGIKTYYDGPPFMLPANTTWLLLNTTKKPMDDVSFRKAVAYSIDLKKIVQGVYSNLVKGANPTGLLPQWDKYIDRNVVNQYGFTHDVSKAKQLLADAGYKDKNGDGLVESPSGAKISLKLIVPAGWTDWVEAARVISASAKEAGIDIQPGFPDYNDLVDRRNSGKYDMVLNNDKQLANTPWLYYDYLFRLPVQKLQTTTNFGRYANEQAWQLTQRLDQVKPEDLEGMKRITAQLQKIQLDEMPVIPLWYTGLWSQTTNAVWKNWPTDAKGTPKYPPTFWRGWPEMGSTLMLTELQPASGA